LGDAVAQRELFEVDVFVDLLAGELFLVLLLCAGPASALATSA